jgi:hypothetical protein
MSEKMLVALGVASALLAIFAIVFGIKILSRGPTPIEVAILLGAVFAAAMGLIYTGLKYLGRNPPT